MTTITATAVHSRTHRRHEINVFAEAIFVYDVPETATHIVAADGLVWWGFRAPAESLAIAQAEANRLWDSAKSSSPKSSEDDLHLIAGPVQRVLIHPASFLAASTRVRVTT